MVKVGPFVLIILASACATSAPPLDTAPNAAGGGHLVIVGGGPIPEVIDRRFLQLAGGNNARIVVLPMASESGLESGTARAAAFKKLGAANAVSMQLERKDVGADSVARILGQATGIWFPGGDQNRLTAAIIGTAVVDSIRSRYRHGAVVGGTSAGAAVMSDPMISGDERRPGGARPPGDSSDNWLTIDRDDVILVPGFGLLPNVTVDQHFLRRKRHNRLISVVLERPSIVGIGIDESTALVVSPRGPWEIIGASQAVVYDARKAAVTSKDKTLGAANIQVHVLPAGSRFDYATGMATTP
jgi:cyanophycinase